MTLEKYLDKIYDLRRTISIMLEWAYHNETCVPSECYEAEKELGKTIRNARAWCKRHNVEFTLQ